MTLEAMDDLKVYVHTKVAYCSVFCFFLVFFINKNLKSMPNICLQYELRDLHKAIASLFMSQVLGII
jgi:hypothetical protein